MLDIHSLEKRWLRYKLKRLFPLLSLIMILFLILMVGITLWPKLNDEKNLENNKTASIQKPIAKISSPTTNDMNNTLLLEPSMEFMQDFSPEKSIPETNSQKPIIHQKISTNTQNKSIPKETVISIDPPKEPMTKTHYQKQPAPLISKTENKIDIENLEVRFKENPNSSLGLFISRYYYDQGNYAQSYNYALKTNNINDKLDESWIIFAKSLVKLGKSEQAKKTLNIYIEQSNSDSAKSLLYSIEKGTFK